MVEYLSPTPIDRGAGMVEADPVRGLLHDLREPLAAILLLSTSGAGDVQERLGHIREQASWLAELVTSSLDGAAGDDPVVVDAVEVARAVAGRARMTTTATIEVEPAGDGLVLARPVALARALGCVVDNAVRAAGPSGHVLIWVGDDDDGVHVRVLDDGPGLGHVVHRTSIGLATTRAMVAACEGAFHLAPRPDGGASADIALRRGTHVLAS
jgi:K+-sensing histidine kinase KdpD